MSTYKVLQDVEAEDKLIGPFTFKQFVFLIVFFISGFVGFQMARINIALTGFVLPFFVVSGVLGFYRPNDQPVETKLLAYINFYFKPRTRLWSRDGLLERVIIQAPKLVERRAPVRSPEEVQSKLKQLSQIIDTRGWVTKQTVVQMPTLDSSISSDDRLITPKDIQIIQDPAEVHDSDDVLAFQNSTSENLSRLASVAQGNMRVEATHMIEEARNTHPAQPDQYEPEQKLAQAGNGELVNDRVPEPHFNPYPDGLHQRTIQPIGATQPVDSTPTTRSVDRPVPGIRSLAEEMSDQTVSAVAAQAHHVTEEARGLEFDVKHSTGDTPFPATQDE